MKILLYLVILLVLFTKTIAAQEPGTSLEPTRLTIETEPPVAEIPVAEPPVAEAAPVIDNTPVAATTTAVAETPVDDTSTAINEEPEEAAVVPKSNGISTDVGEASSSELAAAPGGEAIASESPEPQTEKPNINYFSFGAVTRKIEDLGVFFDVLAAIDRAGISGIGVYIPVLFYNFGEKEYAASFSLDYTVMLYFGLGMKTKDGLLRFYLGLGPTIGSNISYGESSQEHYRDGENLRVRYFLGIGGKANIMFGLNQHVYISFGAYFSYRFYNFDIKNIGLRLENDFKYDLQIAFVYAFPRK